MKKRGVYYREGAFLRSGGGGGGGGGYGTVKPFIADGPKYKDLGSVYMEKSCPGKEG